MPRFVFTTKLVRQSKRFCFVQTNKTPEARRIGLTLWLVSSAVSHALLTRFPAQRWLCDVIFALTKKSLALPSVAGVLLTRKCEIT
jgi:hypothetical protein